MLRESKLQSKSPTRSFYQYFKTPCNNYITQTPRYRSRNNSNHYKSSIENLEKNLVRTRAQVLVQNVETNARHIIILHTLVVPDHAMTNIIEYLRNFHPSSPCYNSTSQRSLYYLANTPIAMKNYFFRRHKAPYRSPSIPPTDRYGSRLHSHAKNYSTINLNLLLISFKDSHFTSSISSLHRT